MKPVRLTLIAAASCWFLASCGGSDSPTPPTPPAPVAGDLLSHQVLATLSAAQINALAANQGLQALTGEARCDVKWVALDYASTGAHGEDTNVTGALLVPTGDDAVCTQEAPLLAYARGTDPDKTRRMANPENSESFMLAAFFAAQGYAVVATDYLGYGGSSYAFHPYLHADSQASSVLDSVRAARQASAELDVSLSGDVLFSGYSQGGHASLAAQRAAERDAPQEFKVLGGAHLAGPYNLSAAMRMEQAIAGYQLFVPFIVTAWQQVYGNLYDRVEDVFLPAYAAGIETLLPSPGASLSSLVAGGKLPGGTPAEAREALFTPAFLQQMQSTEPTPIGDAAADNSLMDFVPKAPVLLCGGAGDPTIPPAVHQQPLAAHWQAQGLDVLSVDVDPLIQATFGPDGKAPEPSHPGFASYYASYHGSYEPVFCLAAARGLFDRLRP